MDRVVGIMGAMSLKHLQGKILTALVLGLVIMVVMGLVSDIREVGATFSSFRWSVLPAILGLTVLNYVLRWLKWDYYLRRLRLGDGVGYGDSGLLFTAGMVMAVTPGKVGEVFKSYLLRRINGTPVSVSAPIVLAERLTDGLGMLLLMALGLTLYPPARPGFVAMVVLSVLGIAVLQSRPLFERLLSQVERFPLGSKVAPRAKAVYTSTQQLLEWRVLLISTFLSFVSWGFECIAFYYVLTGLQVEGTWLLLLQATFIFAASTLFGLVSFLPGGLGTSEITSVGLIMVLVGTGSSVATAATILIRFCTLWFGVSLGVAALAWFGRRYRGDERVEVAGVASPPPPTTDP
jgi:glycosyltransferase 2 family protein